MSYIDDFLSEQSGILPPDQLSCWQPDPCGAIDIRINHNGEWFHNGEKIQRVELVRLFASILRFDTGEGFVLVTPVEKCSIEVEDVPFIACLVERVDGTYRFAINLGFDVFLSKDNPIEVRSYQGQRVPYILVREGLWARCNRNVYYALAEDVVERSQQLGIEAAGEFWSLV